MRVGRVMPHLSAGWLFVWCVIVVTFNGFVQSCISYPARGTLFPKFSKAFICSACGVYYVLAQVASDCKFTNN